MRSKYIAGIWSGDIINGLSWERSDRKAEGTVKSRVVESASQGSHYRAPSFSWASANGPVRFSVVQRNRLTGDNLYEAEIINFDSTPTGFNPLGEVSGGSLTLRARAIPLHHILEESHRPPFDRDDEFLDPSDKRILCISIRNVSFGYLGEQPSIIRQCLLLLPTDTGADIYRRVGFWEVRIPEPPRPFVVAGVDYTEMLGEQPKRIIDYNKPPYEGWEEMDVTII